MIVKISYAARVARFGLLRAVGALARTPTKRGALEDRKLKGLVEYIHSSFTLRLTGFVGRLRRLLIRLSRYGRKSDSQTVEVHDEVHAGPLPTGRNLLCGDSCAPGCSRANHPGYGNVPEGIGAANPRQILGGVGCDVQVDSPRACGPALGSGHDIRGAFTKL